MQRDHNTEIIFGRIESRIDKNGFGIKIFFSTTTELGTPKDIATIFPSHVIVNTIKYETSKLDSSFIESILIGSKVMFVLRPTINNPISGELYKLPFGKGKAIHVPNEAEKMLNMFSSDSDFKIAH